MSRQRIFGEKQEEECRENKEKRCRGRQVFLISSFIDYGVHTHKKVLLCYVPLSTLKRLCDQKHEGLQATLLRHLLKRPSLSYHFGFAAGAADELSEVDKVVCMCALYLLSISVFFAFAC